MAKKSSSPKDRLAALRAKATQQTDPFWGAEEDEWIDVIVNINSIEVEEDEKDSWKTTTTVDVTIDGEDYDAMEVPFWAVDAMFEALEDADVDDDGKAELRFKRQKNGKQNNGKWK